MYALASLGLRRSAGGFLRGRRGTWCSRMYALTSLGLRRSVGGFCMAGVGLGALQGVGCTPWRPLVSAALPVAFARRVRHLVLCKGSDVRPGVPWSTAGVGLGALQGVGCTPWRPLVSAALPVAFTWQAWDLVHCKGSDVWRPLVSAALPMAFARQVWDLVHCKGSDVCPAWRPLVSAGFCVAGVGLGALQGAGRMPCMASVGLRRSAGGFCVASVGLGAVQGVGCTPWGPLVSAALPVAFAWQVRR